MSPLGILKMIDRFSPGAMLDVGARDCTIAKAFAEAGYQVDAIDPQPPPQGALGSSITYHQTTLEQFRPQRRYDLVFASLVSHFVSYDTPSFLAKLKGLGSDTALIYVTLFGHQDAWAALPETKALSLTEAEEHCAALRLEIRFKSAEWFEAKTYAGDRKFWNIYRFILEKHERSA